MSHKATNWAVSQRGISSVAKVLLWQLADRHNPDNGCFPDQDTLARDSEISRASVNRQLTELERVGLVRRVQQTHPVTKRRLPTRYLLAFEEDFGAQIGGQIEPESVESHVSDCDMAFEEESDAADGENDDESHVSNRASHVSKTGGSMSQIHAEPCLTAETRNESLTSKLTSKITKARVPRADRELEFKKIWKAFPERPGSSELAAWEAFEAIEDADVALCIKGAERYAAWFREDSASQGKPIDELLRFVPFMSTWIGKQGWIAAAKLKVKSLPGTDAAALMDATEYVNKSTQPELFAACERLRGKPAPVGASGKWGFPKELVAEARKGLGKRSGDPP